MDRIKSVLVVLAVIMSGLWVAATSAAPASALGNDYPWQASNMNQISPLGFNYRNCTDYAAWTINVQKGGGVGNYKFKWADIQSGGSAHAYQWRQGAISHGYGVNQTPAKGSVAWWGSAFGGGFGHVAIVAEVRNNGNTIDVHEYNANNAGTFGTRTLNRGSSAWPGDFLHIADIPEAPPQPQPTDVDGDGTTDGNDACPSIPGVAYQQGCRQPMATMRGDYNGDGKQDNAAFYVYPERGGTPLALFVWNGRGDGTFDPPRLAYYDASGWSDQRVIPAGSGDFNKDGRTDIAIFFRYDGTYVRTIVWYAQADGSFVMTATTLDNGMEGANLIPVGTGDYNGNGTIDIAALYRYPERGNALSLIVWEGTPTGGFSPGAAKWYNATGWDGHNIVPVGSGEFYTDGRTDISVFYDYGAGVTRMLTWYGRADGTFYDPAVTFYASSGWNAKHLVPTGVGDFDGDGKQDVSSFYGYPERGNAVSMFIWKGNGDGTFQGPQLSWYTPSGWWWLNLTPAGVGDFNGDGRDEPMAYYDYGGSTVRLFSWQIGTDGAAAEPEIRYYDTSMAAPNLRP